MKRIAALAVSIPLLLAQADRLGVRSVTAVRHWSLSDVTRVAVEVSGDFKYRTEHLHNPDRVYFDILEARPHIGQHPMYAESLDDERVKKLRVAETTTEVTRIVLDLAGPSEVTTSQLSNPDRLMIEVRTGAGPAMLSALPHITEPAPPRTGPPKTDPIAPISGQAKAIVQPADLASAEMVVAEPSKNQLSAAPAKPDDASKNPPVPDPSNTETLPASGGVGDWASRQAPAPAPATTNSTDTARLAHRDSGAMPSPLAPPTLAESGKAARHMASGDSSLIRELGLKISRVVIDPGHGGHDQGTTGAKGLLEKELVLDVAKRVGKLIEDKMSAEVVYTRSDDTFIPLERRTAIANEKRADLFLSIHANSSPVIRIAGMETYYLNFADTKDAMDVAARENAAAHESIFELRDIVQKITLHDKAEESKDFASRIQSALFVLSARELPGNKNRGVKKAPFVVLIGAQMPSILAEIGFLSNPREEALLKRPDYRQKVADALFRGVQRYADSLSHFQVAQQTPEPALMRALAFRHVPFEGLGHIHRALESRGLGVDCVDLYREGEALPDPAAAAGLIFMGGPMSVNDGLPYLEREIAILRQALDRGQPVLGVCLGAQLLARAAGARVYPNPRKEIGWYDIYPTPAGDADPLLGELDGRHTVFHWHGETFDLPAGAEWLAYSEACRHQAFRLGSNAYGLQFHLEVTPAMIADWQQQDVNCGDVRELEGTLDARRGAPQLADCAHRVFGRWAALL